MRVFVRQLLISFYLAGGIALTMAPPVLGQAPPSVNINDVFDAWRRREAKIRSARVSWTESRFLTVGAITGGNDAFSGNAAPQPAEDTELRSDRTIVFDGQRLRLEEDGDGWVNSKTEQRQKVAIFDGSRHQSLTTYSDLAQATISSELKHLGFEDRHFPVLIYLFPFRPGVLQIDPKNFRLRAEQGLIDGDACLILEMSGARELRTQWWVDTAKDFVVRRKVIALGTREFGRTDISYGRDGQGRWIPQAWERKEYFDDGDLREHGKVRVTEFSLNVPIEPSQFELNFPEGALVSDLVNQQQYVAREDGEKRVITEAERARGATLDEIRRTESGEAGLGKPSGNRTAWLLGALFTAIGVLLGALWIWRTRR